MQAKDVLAEIETDKAVMDLEAFASGVLRKILVQGGETVPSGTLIGVIGEPDEDITAALTDTIAAAAERSSKADRAPSARLVAAAPSQPGSARPIASPRAKALAAERGIDLSTVTGTGPGGRIVEEDIVEAISPTQVMPAGTDHPLSQMRKAIVRATTQSKAPGPKV